VIDLYLTLAPIALIDSLSVVPIAVVPLLLLLAGKRPLAGSFAFIAGIVLTYLPFGVLLLFGLDALFDSLAGQFSAWWKREPDQGEVVLQIVVGLAMLFVGYRVMRRKAEDQPDQGRAGMTPGQAFTLAAAINVTGMWGALPYFAAIAQILKEDLSSGGMLGALLYYNLVFALPLAALPVLHYALGERAERWSSALVGLIRRWGQRLLAVFLAGLGLVMTADGVGWLMGRPLILPDAFG